MALDTTSLAPDAQAAALYSTVASETHEEQKAEIHDEKKESRAKKSTSGLLVIDSSINQIVYRFFLQNFLARNMRQIEMMTLYLVIIINIILLFYRVNVIEDGDDDEDDDEGY